MDPKYPEAWYQLGFTYGVLGRHADALKASQTSGEAASGLGTDLREHRRVELCLRAIQGRRGRLSSGDADGGFRRTRSTRSGLTLNKLGRTDEEILAYRRSCRAAARPRQRPREARPRIFQAETLPGRTSVFEQLRTYRPEAKTYNSLGESYFELGKTEESLDAFNNAVSYDPDFEKARYNLGRSYVKRATSTWPSAVSRSSETPDRTGPIGCMR